MDHPSPMEIDQNEVLYKSSQFLTWDDLKRTVQNYLVACKFAYSLKRKDTLRAV